MIEPALTIDYSKLTPIESMFGEDFEETQQLAALFEEAELYLTSFSWCEGIKSAYFGLGVSDFIGIFLFEIVAAASSPGSHIWVVAGDIPPAHLMVDECPSPAFALKAYIQKMKDWCGSAFNSGNIDAVEERQLMHRIALLDNEVLSHYRQEIA